MAKKIADLHIHSDSSDGVKDYKQIIKEAKNKGLSAIAITDHDTINFKEFEENKDNPEGIELILGVELTVEGSVKINGRPYEIDNLEIAGYWFGDDYSKLLESDLVNAMHIRNDIAKKNYQKIMNNIRKKGRPIAKRKFPIRSTGELAQAIIKGYKETKEKPDKPTKAYVTMAKEEGGDIPIPVGNATTVIKMIKRSGGVSSLTHVAATKIRNLYSALAIIRGIDEHVDAIDDYVTHLAKNGLNALETNYRYTTKNPNLDIELDSPKLTKVLRHYRNLANKLGLIKTGGSDFHQSDRGEIADAIVSYNTVEKMRDLTL